MKPVGAKKAAIAMLPLSKKDRHWLFDKLSEEGQKLIKAELSRLETLKGSNTLKFQDVYELIASKSNDIQDDSKRREHDKRVAEWQRLTPEDIKSKIDIMSNYGVWLLLGWAELPNKHLINSFITDSRQKALRDIGQNHESPHPWLSIAAVDWFLGGENL